MDQLTILGNQANFPHGKEGLECFTSPLKGEQAVTLTTAEFTCVCPKTGQPDFATIHITYVPKELCVESKSLKLYLWGFRNLPTFHEAAVQKITDDLADVMKPRRLTVVGEFRARGGISITVTCSYEDT